MLKRVIKWGRKGSGKRKYIKFDAFMRDECTVCA
jgi:hypothetical protein